MKVCKKLIVKKQSFGILSFLITTHYEVIQAKNIGVVPDILTEKELLEYTKLPAINFEIRY